MLINNFNRFILAVLTTLCFFSSTMYGRQVKHRHHKKAVSSNRKVNTAALFHSLANTCVQAGSTIGAQTEQEKQQAACNLVGSIFQTAAVLSEKTDKRSPTIDTISPEAINTMLKFLHELPITEHDQLLAPNYTYLQAATALTTPQEQEQFITQILTNKVEGQAFLRELFSLFKWLADDLLPPLFDSLQQDALKNLDLE